MTGNIPELTGDSKKDVLALYDYIIALRKELYDLLYNLDSDNVRQIITDMTEIRSEDGNTYIKGNLIEQTDEYGNVRIRMGNDKYSGDVNFKFEIYNAYGEKTIYMDDDGEATFAGNINTTKNIYVGNNIYMKPEDLKNSKGIYFTIDDSITYGELAGMRIQSEKNIQMDSREGTLIQVIDGDFKVITYNGDAILPLNNSYLGIAASSTKIASIGDVYNIVNDKLEGYAPIDHNHDSRYIRPYYSANRCYIDLSDDGFLVIRDRYGDDVGYVYIEPV